jgi:hypothetical protein
MRKTPHFMIAVSHVLFGLIFIAPNISAQARTGTIAVVNHKLDRIIIAADSRSNFDKNDSSERNDHECKIVALGTQATFLAAGFVGYNNNGPRDAIQTWRAATEARHVYADIVKKAGGWQDSLLEDLGKVWGSTVKTHTTALLQGNPRAIQNSAVEGLLTTALIASGTGKSIRVIRVQIRLSQFGPIEVIGPTQITPEVCPPCALGKSAIAMEFLELTSPRARAANERWVQETKRLSDYERDIRSAIRLVNLTIAYHPNSNDVGGPVDALALRAEGQVRWIQRKPECPE